MRLKLSSPLFSCAGFTAAALLSFPAAQAQNAGSPAALATPSVRITEPVVNESLVTLKGNTHPLAQARYDQGAASTSLATGKLQLLLKRSPAQQIALRQYLDALQDPHSANYRKFLTPQAYGASFGIADQDLQTVEAWLQSQGFKVESVPASRNFIQFSGNTGQVAQAFHTSIHSYVINGVHHYSNASDPQIPSALAPVVAGVSPLNDFHAQPLHVLGGHAQVQSKSGSLQVVSQFTRGATPLLTDTTNDLLFVTPSDAATIYDAPNPLNRNFQGGTQRNGTGVNIGLVGDSDLQTADYLNYRRIFLNETNPVSPTLVVDGADPGVVTGGEADEALLDAEVSAGLAPDANIYFYSSGSDLLQDGATDAALRAIEDNNVSILNFSFGSCEASLGTGGNQQVNELWLQAAAQGITVVVAAGDSGSASCDADTETQATQGLAVSGYASTPYNIAIGGTDFYTLATNFSQYVSSANNGGALPYFGSALSYIPENPWNDSISNNPPGAYAANTPMQYTDTTTGSQFTLLDATGGGASSSAFCNAPTDQNGNCVAALVGYAAPSFQSGLNIADPTAPKGVRTIPDISLFAAPGNEHHAAWAFCSDNTTDGTGTAFTDCQPDSTGQFSVSGIGGTSASTPAFAGILAQVIQSLPNGPNGQLQRLGLANNTLYNLQATSSNSAAIFHDITAGNNSVPCARTSAVTASPNCGTNSFLTGYNATSGYDLASGLGSVDITALIAGWNTVQFTPSTVSLAVNGATSQVSIQHGTPVTLTTAVTPGTATGTVSVTAGAGLAGAAVNENIPLSVTGGTLGGSVSVATLPGGSYSIQAYYQGDVKNSPSTSSNSIPIAVSPEPSTPFLSLAIGDLSTGQYQNNPATAPYGAYGYAYINPANTNALSVGSNGPATGTATLLNAGTNVGSVPLNSQGQASFPLYNSAPGTYAFTAQYSGDGSYNASTTTTPVPLTITKAPTTLTIHTGSAAATAGTTTITVELDTDSAGAQPGGAITLTINGKPVAATATQNGVLGDGAVAQLATFSLAPSSLQGSGNSLQASYPGDTNYNTSSAPSCSFVAPAVASATPPHPDSRTLLAAGGSMALCSVLFFCIPARRRAWRSLLVVFFAIGLMGAVGCGGTSNNNSLTNLPACSK